MKEFLGRNRSIGWALIHFWSPQCDWETSHIQAELETVWASGLGRQVQSLWCLWELSDKSSRALKRATGYTVSSGHSSSWLVYSQAWNSGWNPGWDCDSGEINHQTLNSLPKSSKSGWWVDDLCPWSRIEVEQVVDPLHLTLAFDILTDILPTHTHNHRAWVRPSLQAFKV